MTLRSLFAAALIGGGLCSDAAAAPIDGSFTVVADLQFGLFQVSPPFPFPVGEITSGVGDFGALVGTDVSFESLSITPVGIESPPVAFMAFEAAPLFPTLLVNHIAPGIYTSDACAAAPAGGQTCSIDDRPYNFVNGPPGPGSVSFSLAGVTSDGLGTWQGDFVASLAFNDFQTILSNLNAGAQVGFSFTGTIDVISDDAIPIAQPPVWLLLTVGLVSVARVSQRKQTRYCQAESRRRERH